MITALNNLFNFNRTPLPPPFGGITNKRIPVASKYGDGRQATLCCTVIKALNAVCACMNGSGEGAVGVIDHRSVAEYKSSMSPEAYHLAVFDSGTGSISVTMYNKDTEVMENHVLNNANRDGAAVVMAMFPTLNQDEEFEQKFNEYYDQYVSGFPDNAAATNTMAILCDNVYRRVKDDTCEAHIKVTLDRSGNLMRVTQGHLDSGAFTPTGVIAGEFTIFAKTGRATVKKASTVIEHSDFVGKYGLHTRTLSPQEQTLVPALPEWYIIPTEVVDICKHAQATTEKSAPMRNFLLRGPAGTGKTMGAKAIAAGLHLPYMKHTCSANTEIFDFVGMIFPDSEGGSTGDADLDRERAELESMGGITYANVAKIMGLPGLDDMDYDPAGVYQALTGLEKDDATSQECMAVVMEQVTAKVQALSKRTEEGQSSGQTYRYVDTDFIKALRYGYVIEIQEPSTIAQSGVLVGLNSLLEQSGSITLPTGEIIHRHPDAVVVVTTNTS